MTTHSQAQLRYGDRMIEVDRGMVPLLLGIWVEGLKTEFSCQGGEGQTYISFVDYVTALTFTQETWKRTGIGITLMAEKRDGSGVVRFDSKWLGVITQEWASGLT